MKSAARSASLLLPSETLSGSWRRSAGEHVEYLELARCMTDTRSRHRLDAPWPDRDTVGPVADLRTLQRDRLGHRARKASNTKKWEACCAELTLMNSPRHESGRRGSVPLRYDTGDGSRGRAQNRRGRPASPSGRGKEPSGTTTPAAQSQADVGWTRFGGDAHHWKKR